jgi:hypothetical protein
LPTLRLDGRQCREHAAGGENPASRQSPAAHGQVSK